MPPPPPLSLPLCLRVSLSQYKRLYLSLLINLSVFFLPPVVSVFSSGCFSLLSLSAAIYMCTPIASDNSQI